MASDPRKEYLQKLLQDTIAEQSPPRKKEPVTSSSIPLTGASRKNRLMSLMEDTHDVTNSNKSRVRDSLAAREKPGPALIEKLKEIANEPRDKNRSASPVNALNRATRLALGASIPDMLEALGRTGQAGQAAIYQPILDILDKFQSSDNLKRAALLTAPGLLLESSKGIADGLLGESTAQAGDLIRRFGGPELAAQVGGLVMEGITDPAARLASLSGKGVATVASKIPKTQAAKNIQKGSLEIMQNMDAPTASHMVNTGFRGITAKNLRAGGEPMQELADKVIKQAEDHIYKPAHEAFEVGTETLKNVDLTPADNVNMFNRITQVLNDEVDNTVIDKLLKTPVRYKVKALRTGRNVVKKATLLDALQEFDKRGGDVSLTGREWYSISRSLANAAKKNPAAIKVIAAINGKLENYSSEFKTGNDMWSKWKAAKTSLDTIFGESELDWLGKSKRATDSARVLNYFSDPNLQHHAKMLDYLLSEALPKNAKSPLLLAERIKDIAAAQRAIQVRPMTTAISVAGGAGVAAGALGVPRQISAAGMATGIVQASPNWAAKLGRKIFLDPKLKGVKPLSPAAKAIQRLRSGQGELKDLPAAAKALPGIATRLGVREAVGKLATGRYDQ